ncbi:MAG: heme-binding beta-barrel domain-containing protein [Proteobacteria bacterium]|nr:heme-binding beta-barrel domain-containing protein [Pseudomonadota bacterium]
MATREELDNLGPLAALVGVWEGEKGNDVAPSDARGTAHSKFRERMTFEPTGRVDNHEQVLYGLRYATKAWRLGADQPFHEELGYWLWDAGARQVMRCFLVPRGIAVIAGGTVEPGAKSFRLAADLGSETYGICSNKFLDKEFKTVRYELEVTVDDDGSLTYREDTQLKMKGKDELFHHTDENTLRKVG